MTFLVRAKKHKSEAVQLTFLGPIPEIEKRGCPVDLFWSEPRVGFVWFLELIIGRPIRVKWKEPRLLVLGSIYWYNNLMIQQILFITLETIFETICFNYSLQHGYYFFTAFFGYLLFRRLWTTYVVSRIARAADKSTKKWDSLRQRSTIFPDHHQ